jgi:hypothetical protein
MQLRAYAHGARSGKSRNGCESDSYGAKACIVMRLTFQTGGVQLLNLVGRF